jgi:hypothetical protein
MPREPCRLWVNTHDAGAMHLMVVWRRTVETHFVGGVEG